MAVKKKGLGKGLDSLIPEKSNKPLAKEPAEEKRESESGSANSNDENQSWLSRIEINRVKSLMKMQFLNWQIQSNNSEYCNRFLVRKNKDYYEIIAGERRWRAAKAGRSQRSPCYCKRVYRTGNSGNRFN